MQREGWPEPGSLVVCTVTQVVDFGAFVSLDEYSGQQGLIHHLGGWSSGMESKYTSRPRCGKGRR